MQRPLAATTIAHSTKWNNYDMVIPISRQSLYLAETYASITEIGQDLIFQGHLRSPQPDPRMGFVSRLAATQRVGDTRSRLRCSLGQMFPQLTCCSYKMNGRCVSLNNHRIHDGAENISMLQYRTSAHKNIGLFFAELSIADVSFHENDPLVLLLPLCSLLNLVLPIKPFC